MKQFQHLAYAKKNINYYSEGMAANAEAIWETAKEIGASENEGRMLRFACWFANEVENQKYNSFDEDKAFEFWKSEVEGRE